MTDNSLYIEEEECLSEDFSESVESGGESLEEYPLISLPTAGRCMNTSVL